jgi:hypothetical protein
MASIAAKNAAVVCGSSSLSVYPAMMKATRTRSSGTRSRLPSHG